MLLELLHLTMTTLFTGMSSDLIEGLSTLSLRFCLMSISGPNMTSLRQNTSNGTGSSLWGMVLEHGSFQIYVEAMIIFEAFGDINPGVHHNDRMCYL